MKLADSFALMAFMDRARSVVSVVRSFNSTKPAAPVSFYARFFSVFDPLRVAEEHESPLFRSVEKSFFHSRGSTGNRLYKSQTTFFAQVQNSDRDLGV